MAKEVKVISGSSGTLYTCPAGRTAKVTVTAAQAIQDSISTTIGGRSSAGFYSGATMLQIMGIQVNSNGTDGGYAAFINSPDFFTLSNSPYTTSNLPFAKYTYLAAGQSFSVTNASVTIMVVEEY